MDGSQWMPYQPASFPTPPFPDYVSGHSTYSAAAARILALWTGSDQFGYSVTLAPGGSRIEPGVTPAHLVRNGLSDDDSLGVSDGMPAGQRFAILHQPDADPRETW